MQIKSQVWQVLAPPADAYSSCKRMYCMRVLNMFSDHCHPLSISSSDWRSRYIACAALGLPGSGPDGHCCADASDRAEAALPPPLDRKLAGALPTPLPPAAAAAGGAARLVSMSKGMAVGSAAAPTSPRACASSRDTTVSADATDRPAPVHMRLPSISGNSE